MKKLKNLLFLSLVLVGMVLSLPLTAQASGDNTNQDLKAEWENFKREIEIDTQVNRVEIRSILKEGENKDRIEYEIRTDNELRIQLRYSKQSNSTEVGFKFRVEFDQIIEYIDNGIVGNGFQESEDVAVYSIGTAGWNPFKHSVVVLNATLNETVDLFTATTSDGVFTVTFKVARSLLELNNRLISPNSVKLDVEISNFPYNGPNSRLALKAKIETEFQQEIRSNTTEEELGLKENESEVLIGSGMDEAQGYFSWAERAFADSQMIDVLNSPLADISAEETDLNVTEGEKSFRIFFSFLANDSTKIFWDPAFAAVSAISTPFSASPETLASSTEISTQSTSKDNMNSTDLTTSSIPGFEILVILTVLGLSYIFRKKH